MKKLLFFIPLFFIFMLVPHASELDNISLDTEYRVNFDTTYGITNDDMFFAVDYIKTNYNKTLNPACSNYMIFQKYNVSDMGTYWKINFSWYGYVTNKMAVWNGKNTSNMHMFGFKYLSSYENLIEQTFTFRKDKTTHAFTFDSKSNASWSNGGYFNYLTPTDSNIIYPITGSTSMDLLYSSVQPLSGVPITVGGSGITDISFNLKGYYSYVQNGLSVGNTITLETLLDSRTGLYKSIYSVNRFTFNKDVYSIVFYPKDVKTWYDSCGGANGGCEILKEFTFNGSFHTYKFNFDEFHKLDLSQNNDIVLYSYYSPTGDVSNRNMTTWGVLNFDTPIVKHYGFDSFGNYSTMFKKVLMSGEEDNVNVNGSYYIEYGSNLGYITFDKNDNIIGTDNGVANFIVDYIDKDGNSVSTDLATYNSVVLPSSDTDFNFLNISDNLAYFKGIISYFFSLFAYAYNGLPLVVQYGLVLVFTLGTVIYVVKVLL